MLQNRRARIGRNELGQPRQYFRTAGGTRPDLALYELDGRRVVVKDFRGSDPLFRLLIAPILVRRERAALLRLSGVPGIPQYLADIDHLAFAAEYAAGTSLDKLGECVPDPAFFDSLSQTVRLMHARGVAHCDLRSRGNVILGEDGRPYLVDFAACVMRGRGYNPIVNWLFARFSEADEDAVLLIKKRLAPQLLTEAETARLSRTIPLHGAAVWLSRTIRALTRRVFIRR